MILGALRHRVYLPSFSYVALWRQHGSVAMSSECERRAEASSSELAPEASEMLVEEESDAAGKPGRMTPYEFYRSIGSPKYILAPMVDQSELPFRLLVRRYGCQMTYTPMMHSSNFAFHPEYRKKFLHIDPSDRPLVVQLCGNDPDTVLAAAKAAQEHCDAVDINFGCPQNVARRGYYGAFLQNDWDLTSRLIRTLHENLDVPVFCKIRVFDELERSVAYAKMIEASGCQLLGVHGRTKEMKGKLTGLADWDKIKAIKEALSIPVIANGNIRTLTDVMNCLAYTGVDGVMSAETEGILKNPALFAENEVDDIRRCELALEYLDIVDSMPSHYKIMQGLFDIHLDLRTLMGECTPTVQDVREVVLELLRRLREGLSYEEGMASYTVPERMKNTKRKRWMDRKREKKQEARRLRESKELASSGAASSDGDTSVEECPPRQQCESG